jgi:tetratricopeptide (TPR) repeat protein
MRAAHIAALLTLATSVWATQATAQAEQAAGRSNGTDEAAAKGHYELGAQAYHEGRFAEAIDQFKAADVLHPSPALSFNIAQCFEKQADLKSARHYYVEYLQRKPNAEDRQSVETTIASIDAKLAQESSQPAPILVTAAEPPAPAATASEQAPPAHKHLASWILLGAGGIGLLTGGGLNFAASQMVEGPTTVVQSGTQVNAVYAQANNLWTGALIGYGVGAALGIAGFIVYFVENK